MSVDDKTYFLEYFRRLCKTGLSDKKNKEDSIKVSNTRAYCLVCSILYSYLSMGVSNNAIVCDLHSIDSVLLPIFVHYFYFMLIVIGHLGNF